MNTLLQQVLFLERVDIFKGLSLEELGHLATITEVDHYQEDELLFKHGDPGNYAYIVVTGEVELYVEGKHHEYIRLMSFKEGTCFGEMALLDGQTRSGGARVMTDSVLYRINREDFLKLIIRYPALALGIMSQLSLRLREANSKLNQLKTIGRGIKGLYQEIQPLLEQ